MEEQRAPQGGQSSSDAPGLGRPELLRVLQSAAKLQDVVPDAVLVGGSAAALWANPRSSYDHDHVVKDLAERFDTVLGRSEEHTSELQSLRHLVCRLLLEK